MGVDRKLIPKTHTLSCAVARATEVIACTCGGYADRDHKMTVSEIATRSCGRDTTTFQCCARAFVCRVCGTRWLGMAEAPDMEAF